MNELPKYLLGAGGHREFACNTVSARTLAAFAVAVSLVGCTAAFDAGEDIRTGFRLDGSYVLTEKEQKLDCVRLNENAAWHLGQMKVFAVREQGARKQPPGTVVKAMARVFRRKKPDSDHIKQYRREFAVVSAMNLELVERGCRTVDVASRLEADAQLLGIPVKR